MKRKLLLYLASAQDNGNVAIAATLAWLSASKNYLFDNYYHSHHEGIHFGGGDARNLEPGRLTGGTVSGGHHFEEFYFLLHNFDVSIVCFKETMFQSVIRNLKVPVTAHSDSITDLYQKVFGSLNAPLPLDIVVIGSRFEKELSGLEAYLYPEIFYRQALGVPDSIPQEDLAGLCQKQSQIYALYVDENILTQLARRGYHVEVLDRLRPDDDYCSITGRCAKRWIHKAKGWMLGDPTLVFHWLPTACEERLTPVYSVPQAKIVSELGDLISSKGKVIYGRQYNDRDFFELSKLNQCLQVIDPCRPPFQSVRHVAYSWETKRHEQGFYDAEYSDAELRRFARENRILISLMFWSGMIREVENFHNLFDLFAITGLRCGLVLTAQSFDYLMHSPLELLIIPEEQGGVFPHVEPLLGSCGIGVGIESAITRHRLEESLTQGFDRIRRKVKKEGYLPKGWWATLDTDLERCPWWNQPKPARFLRYSPYFQIRLRGGDKTFDGDPSLANGILERIKRPLKKMGVGRYFVPYRPFEFYRAGSIKEDIVKTVKSVGLEYMFTKSGFNSAPKVQYIDDDFIGLNYTAGQWDGWTPFETVNDVSDLKTTEKILLRRNKPGWIVSTVDSCLWTFSGEFWRRGNRLYDIARFCAEGGKSQKLMNVKPFTISRYARMITEEMS